MADLRYLQIGDNIEFYDVQSQIRWGGTIQEINMERNIVKTDRFPIIKGYLIIDPDITEPALLNLGFRKYNDTELKIWSILCNERLFSAGYYNSDIKLQVFQLGINWRFRYTYENKFACYNRMNSLTYLRSICWGLR